MSGYLSMCKIGTFTRWFYVAATVLCFASTSTFAGTLVRVSTTMGDYTIELFDELTPVTVANFLNYVRDGDYNGTYIHRSVSGFVVQGGGFTFVPFSDVLDVPLDPPIVNEFNFSNTRGTVAMAKFDGDPDSATSQWFVNLSDNSAVLDAQNGGFTAFAQVLGDGMDVVDAIAALPIIDLGLKARAAPYTGGTYESPAQFVTISTAVVGRFSSSLHVYESATGLLFTSVDGGELGALSFTMSLESTSAELVFKVNQDSLINLNSTPVGAATFSLADKKLRIPTLEVFDGNEVTIFTDVVLVLSDVVNLRFTLESSQ